VICIVRQVRSVAHMHVRVSYVADMSPSVPSRVAKMKAAHRAERECSDRKQQAEDEKGEKEGFHKKPDWLVVYSSFCGVSIKVRTRIVNSCGAPAVRLVTGTRLPKKTKLVSVCDGQT
jgi:hypothetical protein